MSVRWTLYLAVGCTALITIISGALAFYPMSVPEHPAGSKVVRSARANDLSQGYVWGLGTGVCLTAVMLLAPSRSRRR